MCVCVSLPLTPSCTFVTQAMTHVFGMALLCRELEAASKFSREYNMDCVTLDGQMVRVGAWLCA